MTRHRSVHIHSPCRSIAQQAEYYQLHATMFSQVLDFQVESIINGMKQILVIDPAKKLVIMLCGIAGNHSEGILNGKSAY